MEDHFFGEWVEYRTIEEREEAQRYLEFWVKFFTRKMKGLELMESQLIDRPFLSGFDTATLGTKIRMRGIKPDNVLTLDDMGLNIFKGHIE